VVRHGSGPAGFRSCSVGCAWRNETRIGNATIAVTAPWIGVAGTITGMAASWVGYVGQKSAFMAQVSWRLTASMWSTALGIIVALAALYSYRYLRDKVEAFDSEMRAASLDLLNQLSRR